MDGVGRDADLDARDFQLRQPLNHAGHDLVVLPRDKRVVEVSDDRFDSLSFQRRRVKFFDGFDDAAGGQVL